MMVGTKKIGQRFSLKTSTQLIKYFINKYTGFATTISFCTLILILLLSNHEKIFIFSISSWDFYLDTIGFILPIFFSTLLLIRKKIQWSFLFLSFIPVIIMAYITSTPVVGKGIISPFPLWLFTPFLAGLIIFLNKDKLKKDSYLYAFILGIFSIFIGADLAHLPSLILNTSASYSQAIFGGAGIFDLILISGVFSVLFVRCFILIRQLFDYNKSKAKFLFVYNYL